MIRKNKSIKIETKLSSSVKERSDWDITKKVIGYMEDNIASAIQFDDVCRFCSLSKTNLKTIFKEKMSMGVMEYYRSLKIDRAKVMIREGCLNFTQLADALGYASIHYFSRHFKKATGMTPSQYALSVKMKI